MNAPTKFTAPAFDCVPPDLKAIPRWIGWRFVERDGDMRKVPQGRTGNIDAHNSENWLTFDDATAFLNERLASGRWPLGGGIGFVFTDDDDIGGVDLDGCRDPETGKIAAWAKRVLALFDGAYVEYSPSETGFHVITRGAPVKLTKTERYIGAEVLDDDLTIEGKSACLEAYVSKRFFTVTGNHATGRMELSSHGAAWEQVAAYLRGDQPRDDREATARKQGQEFEPLGDEDLEAVRSALSVLSSDDLGRNLWVAFGMVIKKEFGEAGRSVWLDWMARSANDDAAVSNEIWDSLSDAELMGVGTIYWHAQQKGWKRPAKSGAGAGGSGADVLAGLLDAVVLWHDPAGEGFATVTVTTSDDSSHRENLPIDGPDFSTWLTREYYKVTGRTPKREPLKEAISLATAKAKFDGAQHKTWVRVATGDDGKLYVDLGDDSWDAVEIDEDGWRIVADPSVKFRRESGHAALPRPERGNAAVNIAKLGELIRPKNPDHLKLVIGVMVACLRAGYPIPGLNFDCEAGSAKTETLRTTRMLIDPTANEPGALPKREDDLLVAANAQWLPWFDNVSNISRDMSDALCRLVTGGGRSARKLYFNNKVSNLSAMRPFLMSTVDSPALENDFVDRTITVPLAQIKDGGYIPLRKVKALREPLLPPVFGALLDGASTALRRLDEVEETHVGRLPRMADFALWAEAAGAAFGWEDGEFIDAYNDMLNERMAKNASDSEFCNLLLEWLFATEDGTIRGPAGKLLNRLYNFAEPRMGNERSAYGSWFPKEAKAMQSKLKSNRRLLAAIGISYETSEPENTEARGQIHCLALNERGRRLLAKRNGATAPK